MVSRALANTHPSATSAPVRHLNCIAAARTRMRARSRTATERESKSPEREESPARVHLPFETRSTALTVLCCVGLVFALDWGHKFFIPLFLGILIAYTLNPLVN